MRIYLLFTFILFLSCSVSKNKTSSLSQSIFSKYKIANQSYDGLFEASKNSFQLKLVIPSETDKPQPLILALHWAGNDEAYKEFSSCLIEPAFEELDAYLIVPSAEQQLWFTPHNEAKILKLIQEAKEHWNIDEDKIIVVGYSNGGNGTWYYAEKHASVFTAAIPMASSYQINQKVKIPVYMIHGYKDELFEVQQSMGFAKEAKELGSDITMSINNELSHYEACAYVPDLKTTIPWLKEKLDF